MHFRVSGSFVVCGTVQSTSSLFQYIIKQKEVSLEFSVDIKEDHVGSTVLKNKTRGFFNKWQ